MTTRFLTISAAASLLCLAACGTHPIPDGKMDRTEWRVADSPELTYRRIAERAKDCYSTGSDKLDADYYAESGEGRIVMRRATRLASYDMFEIRLSRTGSGGTLVRLTTRSGAKFEQATRMWSVGEAGECPYR